LKGSYEKKKFLNTSAPKKNRRERGSWGARRWRSTRAALVAMLEDSDEYVRDAAAEVLGNLKPQHAGQHTAAVVLYLFKPSRSK
jgi:hypothetical protein